MGVHDAGSIERADGPPGNGGPSSRLGCIRVLVSNVAIGVALVVVMALLAATENSWLNGLVPLFPTFALIGQASSYAERGNDAVCGVAVIGLFAIVPYTAYLLAIIFLVEIGFLTAVAVGVVSWLAGAAPIVWFRLKSS